MDIGPSLPPHMREKRQHMAKDEVEDKSEGNRKVDNFGPRLPPHLLPKQVEKMKGEDTYGPSLLKSTTIGPERPQIYRNKTASADTPARGPELPQSLESVFHADDMYGPAISCMQEIGPTLPPQLRNKSSNDLDENKLRVPQRSSIGPSMPHVMSQKSGIGPALPPNLRTKGNDESHGGLPQGSSIGPSLPAQHQIEDDDNDCYGPALPPGYSRQEDASTASRVGAVGPSLPPQSMASASHSLPLVGDKDEHHSSEDETDVIGPMPSVHSESELSLARTRADIEARAKATKDKMLGKNKPKQQRELWMTELPPELSKNFGLGPRKFRAKAADCGDRTIWTDSPAEKARKEMEGGGGYRCKGAPAEEEAFKAPWQEAKDKHMKDIIHSYTEKHRAESLLDQHQRKIKKQKKEEDTKPAERRPFDREVDLAGPGMDPAKRKSLIKKSQELGSRFQSAKKGSSYL